MTGYITQNCSKIYNTYIFKTQTIRKENEVF